VPRAQCFRSTLLYSENQVLSLVATRQHPTRPQFKTGWQSRTNASSVSEHYALVKESPALANLVSAALQNQDLAFVFKSLGAPDGLVKDIASHVESLSRNDLVLVSKSLSEHLVQVMQDNMDLWFGFAIVGIITVGSAAVGVAGVLLAACCGCVGGAVACCCGACKV